MSVYFDTSVSLAYLQSTRRRFSSLADAINARPAYRSWRSTRAERLFAAQSPDFDLARGALESVPELGGLCVGTSGPLGIIVPAASMGRYSRQRRASVWSGHVPAGSFVGIGRGAFVCSPGFCFLTCAHRLSLVRLIELGYRLCGYSSLLPHDAATGLASPRPAKFWAPTTSAAALARYLDGADGCYGVNQARRALRQVLDGAASEREIHMGMLVHSSMCLGGYGVARVALNRRIDASDEARRVSGMSFYIVDLCLSKPLVAMEYDSERDHSGAHAHARDAARRAGLGAMGIPVVTVTNEQLKSQWKMDRVMRDFALKGKLELRPRGYDHASRRIALHLELFGMA